MGRKIFGAKRGAVAVRAIGTSAEPACIGLSWRATAPQTSRP